MLATATKTYPKSIFIVLGSIFFGMNSASLIHADDEDKPDAAAIEFFENKIRPVLSQHCYSCHATDAKNIKGGLLLDSRDASRKGGDSGPAVVPGSVEDSLIISALKYESFEMPP